MQRSCKKLGIELLEGEYDFENWMNAVRGLEKEKEKGKRCEVCFDKRFDVSAHKALELGEKTFTTTLLVSPLKSQEQLKKSGELFEQRHGLKFIAVDYRANGGTQDQSRVTKEEQLYRQDYCGCLFGLSMQREGQHRLMDEMFSPISNQVLPASIEERLQLYKERMRLEDENIEYKIVKHKFLNYREMNFKVIEGKNELIDAFALTYSTLPRKKAQGRIEFSHNNIHYFNREEIKFITLTHLNTLLSSEYKSMKEVIYNPPSLQAQKLLRDKIADEAYDLSPIIIVEKISDKKLTIFLDTLTYEDTKEKLILI